MNQQQSLFDVEETIRNSKSQKASEILTPSTRKILQLLTSQGINKVITASLLDLAGASHEIVQYIVGPIVTQQNGWQQSIPSWVGKAIAVDRLDAALEEIDKGKVGKLASSSEVVALMMPIAFEVPLSSEWTDVYLWASYDALVRHRPFENFKYDKLWEKIGTTPIQYDKIRSDYETLAADIRSRIVKHAVKEGWGKKSPNKNKHPVKATTTESNIQMEQLSLFS
ncbi:MAG: hypothetical protein RMZ41_011295 [Nostoc sp. DedVER02]|uniref:hypothetical protein n=1 Tax=unclassified Nostoc TaxID=2593658 RepID=UPI002AD4AF77|nr:MULTISPECIES: hypothetical protein [unclassified Nostoc]MDZ7989775.1 hypothetical protein [Nostoc sp. DedVER02]MDZ8113329.1 hypothetical protein [Nostoc sp. DedVER01b]